MCFSARGGAQKYLRRNIKMFKKWLSVCLAVLMIASLCITMSSCKNSKSDFKLGVILLHDEASTYDLNFIEAVERAVKELGLEEDQVIYKKNIPESNECYEAAADLVDEGCDIIFADSFGHETYMIKAAKEFPEVQFCHATGTMAHTEKLDNYHNAFASIYEGRFLAGVAAGLKLNEMIDNGEITATLAHSPTQRLSPATPPSISALSTFAPPLPWTFSSRVAGTTRSRKEKLLPLLSTTTAFL